MEMHDHQKIICFAPKGIAGGKLKSIHACKAYLKTALPFELGLIFFKH